MSIDWKPARKITAKERGNRGIFPSQKAPNGFAKYDSCLERDDFLVIDHAPTVKSFKYQPVKIAYKDSNNKLRHYTPDILVEFTNGMSFLIEDKYEDDVINNWSKYEERWDAAEKWAKEQGIKFIRRTEKDIRTARWGNIWFTIGASKCSENSKYIPNLVSLIPEDGVEYNSLCQKLAERLGVEIGKAAQIVCYAIYHGLVFIDTFTTKEITRDTIIRRKHGDGYPFKPLWEEFNFIFDNVAKKSDENNSREDIELKPLLTAVYDNYEDDVDKREKIVKAWLKQPSKKRTPQWRANFSTKWGEHERTIYRWVRRYTAEGRDGLYPKHQNAGRPKNFDKTSLKLIEKARKYYLKTNVTLKKAYRKLKDLCKDNKVIKPKESTFRWYIYRDTTASELAMKRGRKYHKSHFTPSLASYQGGTIPMQVIQMDNTDFDVFPVDSEERKPMRVPYMTASIDCNTRMITGFSISLFANSSQSVLEVLVQSLLPKNRYTETFDTQQEWSINGFPVLILVDNGMDYRSKAVENFCIKYDIILEYAPLRNPRYKALIERWFGVLHDAIIDEDVPGGRPLLKERLENPDLKPEAEAVCTLQDLETWLHKWVIDEYHFTNKYDDHVLAPSLQMEDVQNGRTALIFPSPREPPIFPKEIDMLYIYTLTKDNRRLRSDGVVWQHLKYNNDALSNVFNVIGEKKNVTIFLNRRDIRHIWVINPINDKPIRIGLASGWAQAILNTHGNIPINASAWIRDVKTIKSRIKGRLTPHRYKIEQSRIQRKNGLKKSEKETKFSRREKEKVKEIMRKSPYQIIQEENTVFIESEEDNDNDIYEMYQPTIHNQPISEEDIYETYQPKGLVKSKYPSKSLKED